MQKNIIICDDDLGVATVATIILEEQGYLVRAVNRGEDVIKALIEKVPDLILLDLSIPGISGDELTQYIKKNDATKNIPIIIFSANQDTQKIAQAVGADGFILKPFDIVVLEKMVKKLLSSGPT